MGLILPPPAISPPAPSAISRLNYCTGPDVHAALVSTAVGQTPTTTTAHPPASPTKSSLKKGAATSKGNYSVAFGSPDDSTPDRRRSADKPGFLSPGTLESPGRVEVIVMNLQRKIEIMQLSLDGFQNCEDDYKLKIDAMETDHRQKMMQVEAQSLDRLQEMQREAENRAASLQSQLDLAQEEARQGASARHELTAAREELEVTSHSRAALAEATEKLRKYRDKVTELSDVKEALLKVQGAHGQSVDEVVRLENELSKLQPVKRQVEDYKIRAIEAEVKLVECQDYLRRMERHAHDQNSKTEHLYKGVILQKEQMDEMQRRILQDTQMDGTKAIVHGVGDGISELNPDLKDELVRLRNENLQLRAFQAKRTDDAVQYLEGSLDDAKQLADRYKDEYLRTKEVLGSTQATLAEAKQREVNLSVDVKHWRDRSHETEQHCEALRGQLELCEQQLEQTKISLIDSEDHNAKLRENVRDWMQKKQEVDAISNERLDNLQRTLQELEQTKSILRSAEAALEELQGDLESFEAAAEENAASLKKIDSELQKTTWDLDDTRNKLADKHSKAEALEGQVAKLQKQLNSLDEKLVVERRQRQLEADEAHSALETTRELLEQKNKKEQEELQSNMTRLLDDERKAYRTKDEEANQVLQKKEHEWQEQYLLLQERSISALKHSRQEAQERIDFVMKEYEEDVAKLKQESGETHDSIIRKGRKVLEEAKSKATEEMQRLDDECRDVEEANARLKNDMDELDRQLRSKINSMKQQLDFATSQVNDRTREADEYLDQIKALEREKFKLGEENEQYRRQLGGRFGTDGLMQSQLEKLQKEYSAVVLENRNFKKQAHNGAGQPFNAIMEFGDDGEDGNRSYRRGIGVDRSALVQLRKEYEAQIEGLNDEKRDLIMKMSSQSTDVHKAEKRTWEREEENAKLKAENTSLKLELQRAEFAYEEGALVHAENRSPLESSFHSTRQVAHSPSPKKVSSPGDHISGGGSLAIDRAKKQKLAQEDLLRNRFSSIAGTPQRRVRQLTAAAFDTSATVPFTGNVLSPLNKHKHHPNSDHLSPGTEMPLVPSRPPSPTKSPSRISRMASDVFRLGTTTSPFASEKESNATIRPDPQSAPTIAQYTQLAGELVDDNQQECKQS